MSTVARTRPLNVCRNIPVPTHRDICSDIILIPVHATLIIKITTKKEARVVWHNGVCSYNIPAIRILTLKMGVNIGIT